MMKLSRQTVSGAAIIAGLAATLAGCSRDAGTQKGAAPVESPTPLAALPLTDAPAPINPAPQTSALPRTGPVRVARLRDPKDAYAYVDRAYAQGDAYGDAPPDYTFDYNGVRPWVWRANDDAARFAEPLPGGGYRYFYYEPGAREPYYVQDGVYGYGYSGGGLSVVYGPGGRVLPPAYVDERATVAGALLARAESIFAASRRADRVAVARANWDARRSEIAAQHADWSRQQARDDAWRAYHEAHEAGDREHWGVERERREAEAVHVAQVRPDQAEARHDQPVAQQAADHDATTATMLRQQDVARQRQQVDQMRLQGDQDRQQTQQARQAQLQRKEVAGAGRRDIATSSRAPTPLSDAGLGPVPPPAARPLQLTGVNVARDQAHVPRAQASRAAEHDQRQEEIQSGRVPRTRSQVDQAQRPPRQPQRVQAELAAMRRDQVRGAEQARRSQDAQVEQAHRDQTQQAGTEARRADEAQHAQAAQARKAETAQRAQQHGVEARVHGPQSGPHPALAGGSPRPPGGASHPAGGDRGGDHGHDGGPR